MADNLLDNARAQEAGLPAPKSYAALKRMFRSVIEEIGKMSIGRPSDDGNELWKKLLWLRDYIYGMVIKDRNGNEKTLMPNDANKIYNEVNGWNYQYREPNDWMFFDDGNLSPIDAVAKAKMLSNGYWDLRSSDRGYRQDETHILNKWDYQELFFDRMKEMEELLESLPQGLRDDESFRKYSEIRKVLNGATHLPTKASIELDPILYTENPFTIVQDYAKGLI